MRALRRKCEHMRRIHDLAGDPPLRRREAGFEGLARIVVGQQVSVASANAIWGRFAEAVQPMTVERITCLDDPVLLAVGLSRPKVRTLRAITDAVMRGGLDLEGFGTVADAEVREKLIAVSGIGPWTADLFLMFCLGRADVFAPGDLALQVAAQLAMGLDERPSPVEMQTIAERWSPWRGVAARMLWAYYKVAKDTKSGVPV